MLLQAPGDGISSEEHALPANPQKGARSWRANQAWSRQFLSIVAGRTGLAHLH